MPFTEYYNKYHVISINIINIIHHLLGIIYPRSRHVLRSVAISQDVRITNNHEETSLRFLFSHWYTLHCTRKLSRNSERALHDHAQHLTKSEVYIAKGNGHI